MDMRQLILFEGHDMSGKTTIAQAYADAHNCTYFKVDRPSRMWDPEVNLKYATQQMTQLLCAIKDDIVVDRWIGSDYAYSKLFNRSLDLDLLRRLDGQLTEAGAKTVVCYKQPDAFQEDPDDKDMIMPSQYTEMTKWYNIYSQEYSTIDHLFLDTSDENLEEQLKTINTFIHAA